MSVFGTILWMISLVEAQTGTYRNKPTRPWVHAYFITKIQYIFTSNKRQSAYILDWLKRADALMFVSQ